MSSELSATARTDRIGMLDSTRGIAVLGILLLNIVGFGLPYAYDDPTVWGYSSPADLGVWRLMTLFFEGTMRGLFTLLFGASAWLFLVRHAPNAVDPDHANPGPVDLYFRRTLWLIVFGLFNGYVLLWSGDVLFYYGIAGLVLFAFRNLPPRRLLLLATVFMIVQTMISVADWADYRETVSRGEAASARQADGVPMAEGDQEAIDALSALHSEFLPTLESLEANVADVRDSYRSAFATLSKDTWYMHSEHFLSHGLIESLGMMFFGMALLKLGVLSGERATRTYLAMIVIGYALGLGVNVYEMRQLESANFAPETLLRTFMTYDLGRIPMTLGHLGVIALMCRTSWLSSVMRAFAAVGQMALTNYLSQSLLCLFIFTGAGLAWYGQLTRHELYYVVAAIWLAQLVWSPLWLRHFRHGPAEWLWRSLTYWRWQPMRRSSCATPRISAPT